MQPRKISPFFLLIVVVLSSLPPVSSHSTESNKVNREGFDQSSFLSSANEYNYYPNISAVNVSAVKEHVSFFSGLGTRATGYPSNIEAAEHILEKFSLSGLKNVTYDEFSVADCLSYGANITVLETGETITLHPILPNLVVPSTTPPEGITGRLIYAGTGTIREFDRKEVNGSIVLLEWNSESNWLNAARLGAKAVIFLPTKPKEIAFSLYASATFSARSPSPIAKCLWDAPLNFPRFYVEGSVAAALNQMIGEIVRLVSTHRWTKVTGRNVVGFVEGWERPDGIIVLSSYYDSYSEAPTSAPGAQEALGISTLLELARILAKPENKPPLTIMFIAFGGHHQGLEGARSFVNEHFYPAQNLTKREIGARIWRLYDLDSSTGTNLTFVTEDGNSYQGASGGRAFYLRPLSEPTYEDLLHNYLDELNIQTGKAYGAYLKLGYRPETDQWLATHSAAANVMSTKIFTYDHEPFKILPTPPYVYTVTTLYDRRPYFRTPFDTIEKVNWENLQTQLECTYALLLRSLIEWKRIETYKPDKVSRPGFEEPFAEFYYPWYGKTEMRVACGVIYGKVAMWDEDVAFWKVLNRTDLGDLPNPLVFFKGTRSLHRQFLFAEDDGSFTVAGISHSYYNPVYEISAWVIDPVTGSVVFAPDQGPHKYPTGALPIVGGSQRQDIGYLSVFNASTIAVLDLIYPSNLGFTQDPVTGTLTVPSITIDKSRGLVAPLSYGFWIEEKICILAFPPGEPIGASVKALGDRYPFIVLRNGSEDKPLGRGFSPGANEQGIVTFPILQYAKDFYFLNEDRMAILSRYMDVAKTADYKDLLRTKALIREANDAFNEGSFSKAYALAVEAFIVGRTVYINTRRSIEDIVSVVPFFSFLILPFTFLLEKLLFDMKGLRKAFTLVGIFAVTLLALYMAHPGFLIAANPTSIVIGFSVLILSAPILLIIYSEGWSLLREMRIRRVGVHEIEVSRTGQAIYSFNVGVEYMKKRKFRTVLTVISIITVVSSIISFVSIASERSVTNIEYRTGEPLYEGILIRKSMWGQGHADIGQTALTYLQTRYGQEDLIVPRAWKYTLWPGTVSAIFDDIGFVVSRGDKRIYPKVLFGVTPDEGSITPLFDSCLKTGGLPLVPGLSRICYITELQAAQLGIHAADLPADVSVETMPFKVVGIIPTEAYLLRIRSLDGESITPVKRDYPPDEPKPWNEHLPQDEILIMPFDDVMLLGGEIASISIIPRNPLNTTTMADEIYTAIPSFQVYSNSDGQILLHGGRTVVIFGGFETQIVPLVIVGLTIFNIVLGSVYERKKHISIYSSLGLSPLHVAILFLAETLVYGVIGGVIGYLAAMVQLRMYEAIIGVIIANYFSSMVVTAIGMGILATILSALYPAYLASRLVTPSLERAWRIPTRPLGDIWSIPLPFFVSSETEARSILAYLHEFLVQHQTSDAPVFIVSDLRMEDGTLETPPAIRVVAEFRLAPYYIGVTQETQITAIGARPERWEFSLVLRRTGGAIDEWTRLNRGALTRLREQLLLWRTLPDQEKARYRGA